MRSVGRLMDDGWSKALSQSQREEELKEAMSASRAWMEITPEKHTQRPEDTVQVGEFVLLTVKSTLPGKQEGEGYDIDLFLELA